MLLDSLRISCFYQMDIKSIFLNRFINEEEFVTQPQGFIDHVYPNHVLKLRKALYGLQQAPRARYDRLKDYLFTNDFKIGAIDSISFVKSHDDEILLVQIYVDAIIFGPTNESFCKDFSKCMHRKFELSMMGPLK